MGRSTVAEYLRRAEVAGLSWPLPEGLDDETLERRLFPPTPPAKGRQFAEADWAAVHRELKRPGVTLALLWDEYRGRHPDGYGFVTTDDEGPDIFLGPNEMREVLHGDRVMVRVAGMDRRGRPEGKLVEVLPGWNTPEIWLTLYYPPYEQLPLRVATFSDFFEAFIKESWDA